MLHTVFSHTRSHGSRSINHLLTAVGLAAVAASIALPGTAHGQSPFNNQPNTWTDQHGQRFSNVTEWNFTSGFTAANPIPFSSTTQNIIFNGYGNTNGYTASNDLNLTLNRIALNYFSPANNVNLATILNGTYTFTGAGTVQINGSGGGTGGGNFGAQFTGGPGIVLASTATGLTFNSAGSQNGIAALNTSINTNVQSNTLAGAPIIVNTGGLQNAGVLSLNGANTFGGGVSLVSGNLNLQNAGAIGIFGNVINTLTINSTTSGAATISTSGANTFINPIVTSAGGGDFVFTGGRGNEGATSTFGSFLANGISGPGNVVIRPPNSQGVNLAGINSYTGSTTIGNIYGYASNGSPTGAGTMRLQGALGQVTATTGFSIVDGAVLEINYGSGQSIGNTRISNTVPFNLTNGYIQVINGTANTGVITQNLGTITSTGGLTTILANAAAGNDSTAINIGNLVRANSAVYVLTGQSLGTAAVATGTQQATISAAQINGNSTATAAGLVTAGFVGGGFYNTIAGGLLGPPSTPVTNVSILPYAMGNTLNTGNLVDNSAGASFVTYDAFGFRPLNTTTEYKLNDFTTAAATDNVRIAAAVVSPTAPTTVNSVFFANTGQTLALGANNLQITSGALASNVAAATISGAGGVLNFGGGGTGEGVVTVTGALNSTNTLNISAPISAGSLTKSGFGILQLSAATGNTISGPITVNAGAIQIATVANLGSATSLVFNMNDYAGATTGTTLPGGLLYTGAGTETLTQPIAINSGRANVRLTGAGTLTLDGGVISGTGGLNIDNANTVAGTTATVQLLSTNTFAGGVRLSNAGASVSSKVVINGDAAFGAATGPLVLNAANMTLQLTTNPWNTSRQVAVEGNFGTAAGVAGGFAEGFDTNGLSSTWSGQLLGGGTIFKIDSNATPGVWTIASANNPFTGTIQLGTNLHAGGTLALTGDINSGSVTFGSGATSVAGTYVLDISGGTATGFRNLGNLNTAAGFTQAHTVQMGATALGPVDLVVGGGTFGGTAGQIVGFGNLIVSTQGTFTLNGTLANTFTGAGVLTGTAGHQVGVELWGGTFTFSRDNQLGDASNSVAQKGGALLLPASTTIVTPRDWLYTSSAFTLVGAGPENNINFPTAGFGLEIDGLVSGSGGFEKAGAGFLKLTGNNVATWKMTPTTFNNGRAPYGGFAKINTGALQFVGIDNSGGTALIDAPLGDPGNKIVLLSLGTDTVGGTLELVANQGTATRTGPSTGPVFMNRQIYFQNANSNRGTIQVDQNSFLQVQGSLFSGSTFNQQINFLAQGTAPLGQLNFDANWSNYVGAIAIGNGTAANGNVFLTANAQIPRVNVNITAASAATLDMAGLTKDMGGFVSSAGTTLNLGTGGKLTYGWNNGQGVNGAGTIAGNITGDATASVVQVGAGNMTISSAANTFGGGYTVGYTGGLSFTATGTLPAQTAITVGQWGNWIAKGPTLSLESTIAHLATTQVLNLNNGELAVLGAAAAPPVAQNLDTLNGAGFSTVTAGTTTAPANINFANVATGLTRVGNGTFLFRSGSTGTLGSGPTGGTNSNLFFGNPLTLVGGGGAAGTAQISILPYAIGDDTATGGGSALVTYGANGVRTLQVAANEYNPNLAGAGATDNVRLNNAALTQINVGAAQTANALVITAPSVFGQTTQITGTNLTLGAGTLLNAVNNVYTYALQGGAPTGVALGVQTGVLNPGGGQQLNVFAAGDLAIGAQVAGPSGPATLIKSGGGTLYLTNATNLVTPTVNAGILNVDSLAAISDGAGNTLTLGGGVFKYRGGNATLQSAVSLVGGMGGAINVASGTTLTTGSAAISGSGGLIKDGTGTLVLQGTNTFNGSVILQGGAVSISAPGNLGNSTRFLFDATGNGAPAQNSGGGMGQALQFTASMALGQEFDVITNSGVNGVNTNAGTVGAGFDVVGGATSVTLNGPINAPSNNGRGLYKLGTGNLTLTAAEPYAGATQVFGGTLTIGGPNGSILNSGINGSGAAFNGNASLLSNFGATVVLDNTGVGNANSNRIPSGFTTGMSGGDSQGNGGVRLQGGNFTLKGNATTAVNEYAGQFNVFAGTITIENSGASVVLQSGRFVRTDGNSIGLIRGRGLGAAGPAATRANWYLVDQGSGATQLGGAGGAKGTPYIDILAGFMADATAGTIGTNTNPGTDLTTYSADVGFRTLAATEYKATFDGTIIQPNYDVSRAPNISLSAATTAPSFSTWITALKMSGTSSLTGTAGVLLQQSTILATNASTPSITLPVLGSIGNGGYDILTAGTANLTVNANLNGNKLYMYGGPNAAGTVTLAGAYYGNGTVFVGQGTTLALSGATASLNPIASDLAVAFGGTFNLNPTGAAAAFDRTVASIANLANVGTFNLNQVSDGTINLGANMLTLYDSTMGNNGQGQTLQQGQVFTGQITGTAASTLRTAFNAAGTLTLTQPQAGFNGTLRINNGTVQLAGAGTMPGVTAIDIRGGNFGLNNSDDSGAGGGYIAQRISSSVPINLAGGLVLTGNANTPPSHAIGPVAAVGNANLVVTNLANAPSTVSLANLSRAANHGTFVLNNNGNAPILTGFNGFGSGWTTNATGGVAGSAVFPAANVLQLTPANNSVASSAWFNTKLPTTGPLVISFTYTVPSTSGSLADGLSFGFQNSGLTAIGAGGGGLGIQGVTPSIVVQMNNFPSNTDNGSVSGGQGSGIGVLVNGAAVPHTPTSFPVNFGFLNNPTNVVMVYDGTNANITLTQNSATYTASFPFNLAALGTSAFFGFTGGTGGLNAQQLISNLTVGVPSVGVGNGVNGGSSVTLGAIEGGSPALALLGGGGAAGSTTVSILPWAWSFGTSSWMTYNATNGLRPLDTVAEYLTIIPVAPSDDNVRLTAAAATTLALGNNEMGSLIQAQAQNINGAAGGASTLTVRTGALGFIGASTVAPGAGGTLAINTGSGNTRELVVFNNQPVTLNANISTSGGVTKFGNGVLTLAAANTFTGGLTINDGTVVFSADNQLGGAGGPITFGIAANSSTQGLGAGNGANTASGFAPNGLGLRYVNPGAIPVPLVLTRPLVTNSFGGIIGPQFQVTTLTGGISGTGTWAYNMNNVQGGQGSIYEPGNMNSYTGDTYINNGLLGLSAVNPDGAFGGNSTSAIILNTGGVDGFVLRGDWTSSHTIHMKAGGAIDTNGFTATWNGQVIGGAGLTLYGRGALVLTSPNPSTGAITLNAGTLRLTGNGALVAAPAIGFGTQLILDDTGTHYSDRLPENASLSGNNWELALLGNNSVTTEQVISGLTLGGFATRVTVAAGSGQSAILRLAGTLTRSTGNSTLFRGTNLGTAVPGTANVANIMLFNPIGSAGALTGGAGPANNTAISIVAGGFGDTSPTGLGTQLVTYDLNNGVRLLNPATEYATTLTNGQTVSDNMHVSATVSNINNPTGVNSLWIDGTGGPVSISGTGALNVASGTILVTGTGNTLGTTAITAGTAGNTIAIGGPGDLNITGSITSFTTGGLTKSGAGTLTLNSNAYTGTTELTAGTLVINSNTFTAGANFRFVGFGNSFGTLKAGSPGLTMASTVTVGLDGDINFSGSNSYTIAGTVNLDSATRAINVDTGLTLTLSGTLAASAGNAAGVGIIKGGAGKLVLTGNNTYGSAANSTAFYLTQTVVNNGELAVNGQTTTNSGTGGSTVVVNSGATLAGSGQIIPLQQLRSRNTVVINSGGILAPGPDAPGTLTIGSATTPGTTDAQVNLNANSFFKFLYTSGSVATAPFDSGSSQTSGSATGNNLLLVHGNLALDAGTIIDVSSMLPVDFPIGSGQTYSFLEATADASLANYSADSGINPGNFTGVPAGYDVLVHNVGNNLYLNIQATVPEPGTMATAGAVALFGLAGMIRRRRKAAAAAKAE
jgi:autotransporter-associated beta strand protein